MGEKLWDKSAELSLLSCAFSRHSGFRNEQFIAVVAVVLLPPLVGNRRVQQYCPAQLSITSFDIAEMWRSLIYVMTVRAGGMSILEQNLRSIHSLHSTHATPCRRGPECKKHFRLIKIVDDVARRLIHISPFHIINLGRCNH